jgi:NitT/TauT family transport system permease protein
VRDVGPASFQVASAQHSWIMGATPAQLSAAGTRPRFGFVDLLVLLGLLGILWSVLHFGQGMLVHFDENTILPLSLDPRNIPYYAGRTLLRMWIAFGCSLLFTLAVGYAAARNRVARGFILPALDVLQSVPVLGFLSATITGFMALFPHSLLGVECASIFAIFTGQVWNMTFGFYHSLVTVPHDMTEAAEIYRLSAWQRFRKLETPASAHSLIWNSMISFGGGWFFVAQSEAISVMNRDIKLPGLGSYMATAVEQGNSQAALAAIVAMLVLILVSDQLVWRPLLAWADRFKIELTASSDPPRSWCLNLLRRAYLFPWLKDKILRPISDRIEQMRWNLSSQRSFDFDDRPAWKHWAGRLLVTGLALWLLFEAGRGILSAGQVVAKQVTGDQMLHVFLLGVWTMLRVVVMTVIATLIWTPIGVWIGFRPSVARLAQPIAQIAASFPVNMTFPFVVGFFVAHHVPINWGSILLIGMGTQWYILFNVTAGAMAIPNDLREVATSFGLRNWKRWCTLILPAIFPFWVTGACTAAGGAWNASIVAEFATWGKTELKADGLGALFAEATEKGATPLIICSIGVMALFVVLMNKLVWRRLYALAEARFRLD